MKIRRRWLLKKPLLIALVGTVAISGAALAYTSSTFQSGADTWVSFNCGGLLSGLDAPVCFSVLGVEEGQTALATTNSNVAANTTSIATNTSAIASLNTTVSGQATTLSGISSTLSGQATTISGLSSSVSSLSTAVAGKQELWLYDASNNLLGMTSLYSDDNLNHYFDPVAGLEVSFLRSTGAIADTIDGNSYQPMYYASGSCTGQGYILPSASVAIASKYFGEALGWSPSAAYKITSTTSSSFNAMSQKAWNGSSLACTSTGGLSAPFYPASQVTLNATFPVAVPTVMQQQ